MDANPTLDSLPHISEVTPLSETDGPLIQELVAVLKKHNALDRFGLTLLHKHFSFSENEVLLEDTDIDQRIQTIRPVSKEDLSRHSYIETAWHLKSGQAITACACVKVNTGHLPRRHKS